MLSILIVDDEPAVVELVRVTLEDERVTVRDAADGEGALLEAMRSCPDLVLLDVQLPGMSGFDVCRELRTTYGPERTKIVMLTAATRPDDVARGLAAGADQYLTKPFSPVRLLSLVENLMPQAVRWSP